MYGRYWTDHRLVRGFKGGTLEWDLLTEMKIPWFDLKAWGCPKFKDMTRLAMVESCGYQWDPWQHHCACVECYHFANWVRTRLGLGEDLNVINVERMLRFVKL